MNTLSQVRLLRRLPSTGLQSNLSALADTLDLDADNSLVGVEVAAGNYTIPGMHASQLAIGTYLQIDDEVMLVLALPSNASLAVLRGAHGTVPAAHAAGVTPSTLNS